MLQEKILQIITAKDKKSGGHNGVNYLQLINGTREDYQTIRKTLGRLYKDGKIIHRPTKDSVAFFLKKERKTKRLRRGLSKNPRTKRN